MAQRLTLSIDVEDSATFRTRLASLMIDQGTHIYIDTSFLMWLTKVGSTSRRELIDWFKKYCPDRVHVPVWAAHEYLKHHVADTIVSELTTKANEVTRLAENTYAYFRPFLDEPFGQGTGDPAAIRTETRMTLAKLSVFAATVRQWKNSYPEHASEVISFINTATPEQTVIYDQMDDMAPIAQTRFTGSVPPGYKDRWKKGRNSRPAASTESGLDASNRYGDLHFWREILAHAKFKNASAMVVVTNDRKNDWHLGNRHSEKIDPTLRALKKKWPPVPKPHPMLVTEAKVVANVDCLELLDAAYLAALLRGIELDAVKAFADVAIIPDIPDTKTPRFTETTLPEQRRTHDPEGADALPSVANYLFTDSPNMSSSRFRLARALLQSRGALDEECEERLSDLTECIQEQTPLSEVVNEGTFAGFDNSKLVIFGRELHDRVLTKMPGYLELASDLLSLLDRLPPNLAASLFLGMLSSMYLLRPSNNSRVPPFSPLARHFFERQFCVYASTPIDVVRTRILDNEFAPLYVPNKDCPTLQVAFDIQPDALQSNRLCSLRIGDIEILTPTQLSDELNLRALFDSAEEITGEAVLRKACELFALPFAQIERVSTFDHSFTLTSTVGFKRPRDVAMPQEVSDDE